MEAIVQALALKEQLDTLRPIDIEQEKRIMQKFRLDWNYHSNHLEGNSLNYGETKALLLFGITAQGKPLKDHFEITGHNEAIDWVIDMVKGNRYLTENFIRELHQLLLKEPYEVDAITPEGKPTKRKIAVGQYKTMPNHVKTVTGEMFYFATPEETPAKMHDLLVWYNEKITQKEFNPILIAAEFHYKFIRIHPFDDGNGRTARILMNFILMQFHYPPVIVKTEDKANYFTALQLADAGNIEAFVEYIAQNLVRSLEIMISGANGENIEEDDDIDKEIALLEQRLNSYKNNDNNIKSPENIKRLLVIVEKTVRTLKSKSLLFSKMYNTSEFEIIINVKSDKLEYVGNNYKLKDFLKNSVLNSRIEKINWIEIKSKFKDFKNTNFYAFSYDSSIYFYLREGVKYDVSLDFLKNLIFEKTYGDEINDNEINEIVKLELKRHKNFIEQKIAEKEKE
jgi:Fic family protein